MAKKSLSKAEIDPSLPLENAQWETFCRHFTDPGNMYGNATDAYLETYDIDLTKPNFRQTASVSASQLLQNPILLARINFLLGERLGLTDESVDKQMGFLIMQSADLRVKLGAIREYNNVRGRIKRKLELSFDGSTDQELDAELEAIERELELATAAREARGGASVLQDDSMPMLTPEQIAAAQSGKLPIPVKAPKKGNG